MGSLSSDEESDVVTFEVRAPDGRVIELEQPIGDLVSTANEYVTDKFGKSSATSLLEMVQLRLTKPQRYKLLASLRVMCWLLSRNSAVTQTATAATGRCHAQRTTATKFRMLRAPMIT